MSFASEWAKAEKNPPPAYLRNFVEMDWRVFTSKVAEEGDPFVERFVESVYSGDAWFLKGAFHPDFVSAMKSRASTWTKTRPESFHKMLDGCPDFHRLIDLETGKKYSIKGCKHSAYFFRWNDDPLGIWPEISDRWRVLKMALGLRADEYEHNTPSMGGTDRIQVVRYPPAIGYLEPHIDAVHYQRCFISGYLSKRGVDYEGGGFYFVSKDGKAIDAESLVEVGDLCIGYATLPHGVAPCDLGKPPSWDKDDGRWFLGLYSNASDYEAKRQTAIPVDVEIHGVRP